jgi:hypothetical protein
MLKLTETFYKILDTETMNWFTTKNSKTVWARLNAVHVVLKANNLDTTRYKIYEFVAEGSPIERSR